jgi:hypothetical protein
MDTATVAVIIAAAALLLNLVQRIFGGGWNLSKSLNAVEVRLQAAIEASKKEIEEQQRSAAHDFGETVSALKEHVRQVEFHLRDNYIRKDDFIVHMKSHDDLLRLNFANITSRLERIEKTLDQKT